MNGYEWKQKAFGASDSSERCSSLFSRVARDVVFIDCDNADLIEYYPRRLVPWGLFERLEWLYDFLDKIIMVDASCFCCTHNSILWELCIIGFFYNWI